MDAFERTMVGLEGSLLVAHVAASPLRESYPGQMVAEVQAWTKPVAINNVPVRRNARIVGVVENINGDLPRAPGEARLAGESTRIEQAMRPLASDMLIEGAQPLSGLIDVLLEPPHYRLVVDGGGLEAIVTPSDLSKLPMRVLVYCLLAHLEATMIEAIRSKFPTDEDAIDKLDRDMQGQIHGSLTAMHDKHLDPDLLEVASLKQKALILTSADVFIGDRDEVAADFADLYERLRNPLMHAADFVDDSLEALAQLKAQLNFIRRRTVEAARAAET